MTRGKGQAAERYRGAALAAALAFALSLPSFAGVGNTVNEVCRTSSDAAFRAKYCQAAKDNKKGYVANRSTSTIWGGVSVVCFAACAKVATQAAPICQYSQLGGSVADGAITKKFVDSIAGGAGAAVDTFKKPEAGAVDASTLPKSQGGTRFNGSACTTAATTAKKSFDKKADAEKNEKSLNDLRDQTVAMNTTPQAGGPNFAGADAEGGKKTGAATGGAYDPCDESALKSAVGAIRCAARNDPTLPAYVKSENFVRDLERATGKTADEFFAGFDNPASALLDSPAAAGLSAEAKTGMAEALLAMEKRSAGGKAIAKDTDGYRPGSTAKPGSAEGEAEFDVNAALAGLLGQGEGAEEKPAAGVDEVALGSRAPAGGVVDPEDRTVSIFDRVKWRYGAVSAREQLGGER